MNRLNLLGLMIVFCAMLAMVIALDSSVAAVVGPVREIEEIWEIEDARSMSSRPLVTILENNGLPLAYDAQENTFYCTLGMGCTAQWPELELTAPGAEGVEICFVDDYAYDDCSEAIANGYSYELIAYTPTEYAYFYLVFVGMPLVVIDTQQEVEREDVLCSVSVITHEAEGTCSAQIHQRGAGSAVVSDKKSYTVDIARDAARANVYAQMPLMGTVNDFILVGMVTDDTLMRDKLSWTLYGMLRDGSESFGARETWYVEVFVGEAYQGVYLMMEPVDAVEEITKTSARNVGLDSLYRTTVVEYAAEREYYINPVQEWSAYELFYSPNDENGFAALERYIALEETEDDAAFCDEAMKCVDVESILMYYLMVQAAGMGDNVYNNMYIWAQETASGTRYQFFPWDMDLSWGRMKDEETGEVDMNLFPFEVAQRMIDLDAGGITRSTLSALWETMRRNVFTNENVNELVTQYAQELNDSGAFARNAARWGCEEMQADGYGIYSFATERFGAMDAIMEGYAASADGQRESN